MKQRDNEEIFDEKENKLDGILELKGTGLFLINS
jgi:hypothetical protein